MYKLTVILGALIAAGIISVSAIVAQSTAIAQDESSVASVMGGTFASVKTEITDSQIIITIDRNPNAPPVEPGTNVTTPEGPIIIIPPNNETGQNGTIIIPEPLPPVTNETTGNVTLPVEPPVIIVDPEGNSTTVTPPSNVTVIDNGTVVVAPPDQPVTETPGNVTVIDPPAANVTEPAPPCECPQGVSGAAPDIQAPGANITMQNETTIIREDTEPGTESGGDNGDNGNNGG